MPWRDSPAVGPWSADPGVRARLRAQYWGLPAGTDAFREEEDTLQAVRRAGSAVLWFSAEPWDQMAQLWVLARLSRGEPRPFLTLATLREGGCAVPAAALDQAFQLRQPLAPGDREQAAWLWDRFEAEDWPALWKWLHQGREIPSLPFLARALARVLEDRPPLVPGRTERQVRELKAAGVRDLPAMMRALGALEAPYGMAWYGDLVVRKLMEGKPGHAAGSGS